MNSAQKTIALTLTLLAASLGLCSIGFAQGTSSIPAGAFVDLSLRAISSVSAQDRRGARSMFAEQVGLLPQDSRQVAANALFAKLRGDDAKTKNDILGVLAVIPTYWATADTNADSQFIYQMLLQASDDTVKTLLDNALANAKGLYKDGISDFNSTTLSDLVNSAPKLKTMGQKFPKSRYGERASFYLGQSYSKRFLLNDPQGKQLLNNSNSALEDFIVRAEHLDFGNKPEYLAAGYFYRGLNGWIAGDASDAGNWMNKGQLKFTDNDLVYIYQLFVSTDKSTVIDKYLPAKTLFSTTLKFLNQTPIPLIDRSGELISILRR